MDEKIQPVGKKKKKEKKKKKGFARVYLKKPSSNSAS